MYREMKTVNMQFCSKAPSTSHVLLNFPPGPFQQIVHPGPDIPSSRRKHGDIVRVDTGDSLTEISGHLQ